MSRSSIGHVRKCRQAGRAIIGRRSIRRTRKRKERERAPITIDARRATDPGTAVEQDALDRIAAGEVGGCPLGRERAAEVHDAPHPGSTCGIGESLRRGSLARGKRDPACLAPGRLHRMDQVIGDLDVAHRPHRPRPGERVADHKLEVRERRIKIGFERHRLKRRLDARAVACQCAHVVALPE